MRKGLVITLCAATLAATTTGVLLLGDDDRGRATNAPEQPAYDDDVPLARQLAQQACEAWSTFGEQVGDDRPADEVRRTLDGFRATAQRAYRHDVRWIRLASAALSLEEALRTDDADAAALGMTVAAEECDRAQGDG